MIFPSIEKAQRIFGKNLILREIDEADADFVLGLRLDPANKTFLSTTSANLEEQIDWIRNYKSKKNEAYFIVCDKAGKRLGCVRLYDPSEATYCWGSWLMVKGLPPLIAIEVAVLVYAYAKHLGFRCARISVRKDNKFVCMFHEKFFAARLMREDKIDRHYQVDSLEIDRLLTKYSYLINYPLNVQILA